MTKDDGNERFEQRTAEYRISNCRILKDGFATLSLLLYNKDRIPSFDIRYSIFISSIFALIDVPQGEHDMSAPIKGRVKVVSKPRNDIRWIGKTPIFTMRHLCLKNWSGFSIFVTAVGAVSICARRFRPCSMRSMNRKQWSWTGFPKRSFGMWWIIVIYATSAL